MIANISLDADSESSANPCGEASYALLGLGGHRGWGQGKLVIAGADLVAPIAPFWAGRVKPCNFLDDKRW